MVHKPLAMLLIGMVSAPVFGQAPGLPAQHDSRDPHACARCRGAYEKALAHTLERLPKASFPAKMIMGWLLLADGRYPRELDRVVTEALHWKQRVGTKKAHNHRRNWYPALAGILLLEVSKHRPSRELDEGLKGLVEHFAAVQERTGGWFKWHEGAYRDRLDYPVKDLGMLDAMVFGLLSAVRARGIRVPAATLERADACLAAILSDRGIAYGTGSRGGDITGARGAFALKGLAFARERNHAIAGVYERLLPKQIRNMDKGHHVGGLHCLGVTLGCHLLGPRVYRELTARWLDALIDRQLEDGGIYVGDDEDAGGEKGLLGEDDASTAASALLILLQDPTRLDPGQRPSIEWLALEITPPHARRFARAQSLARAGKLSQVLALAERALGEKRPPPPAELAEAKRLRAAVETHAGERLALARAHLEALDLITAQEILAALAGGLGRHPIGEDAARSLARIDGDAELVRELAAQNAFAKAWRNACRRGMRTSATALRRIAERHAGTRAARVVSELLEGWD